jgi:signal transduction histidine kinase
MSEQRPAANPRILVIDDNAAIHADIRKLFAVDESTASLEDAEADLFGDSRQPSPPAFQIDSASQGQEGLALVERAVAAQAPYALAFVDMRMPPGWDGLTTICHLWRADPELQVVICTAYSDHSWAEIVERLGQSDNLLVLKKPFDAVEVTQMAHALSEKWALRRRLAAQMRELEAMVCERTRDLEQANRQLKREMEQRGRMAEDLRKAERLASLGTLTAGVAHELNNPLAYTIANLEFMEMGWEQLAPGGPKEEMREALAEAHEGAERMRHIVANMRMVSRMGEEESWTCDANVALERALRSSAPELARCARLTKDLAELPRVRAHEQRLTQVFINLLTNAAQSAGEPGRAQIEVHLRTWADDAGGVNVEVADNGLGIDDSIRGRIFDPFFTTKPIGEGTGLGLAICHSIVTGAGGTITVDSAKGEGSRFTVRLISAQAAEAAEQAA